MAHVGHDVALALFVADIVRLHHGVCARLMGMKASLRSSKFNKLSDGDGRNVSAPPPPFVRIPPQGGDLAPSHMQRGARGPSRTVSTLYPSELICMKLVSP